MSPRHGPMLSRKTLKSFDKNTLKRLLNYFGAYKALLAVVVVCVLISAIASAASSLFLRTLIDDYITPLIGVADPDLSGLLHAIFRMCLLLASGIVATLAYSWIMAFVAQRTMERMRKERQEAQEAALKELVDEAVRKRKTDESHRETFMEIGRKNGLAALKEVLGELSEPIDPFRLINPKSPGKEGSGQMAFGQLSDKERESLRNSDKKLYAELFEAEYGFKPDVD